MRKARAEKEMINDYNGDLVKFFLVLQNSENCHISLDVCICLLTVSRFFVRTNSFCKQSPNILDDIEHFVYTVEDYSWEDIKEVVAFFLKIRCLVFPPQVRPLLSPNGI